MKLQQMKVWNIQNKNKVKYNNGTRKSQLDPHPSHPRQSQNRFIRCAPSGDALLSYGERPYSSGAAAHSFNYTRDSGCSARVRLLYSCNASATIWGAEFPCARAHKRRVISGLSSGDGGRHNAVQLLVALWPLSARFATVTTYALLVAVCGKAGGQLNEDARFYVVQENVYVLALSLGFALFVLHHHYVVLFLRVLW